MWSRCGGVRKDVDDDASFASDPFTLTSDHREKEIVIRLTERRMPGYYGFAISELPTETGSVPLAAPLLGVSRSVIDTTPQRCRWRWV